MKLVICWEKIFHSRSCRVAGKRLRRRKHSAFFTGREPCWLFLQALQRGPFALHPTTLPGGTVALLPLLEGTQDGVASQLTSHKLPSVFLLAVYI